MVCTVVKAWDPGWGNPTGDFGQEPQTSVNLFSFLPTNLFFPAVAPPLSTALPCFLFLYLHFSKWAACSCQAILCPFSLSHRPGKKEGAEWWSSIAGWSQQQTRDFFKIRSIWRSCQCMNWDFLPMEAVHLPYGSWEAKCMPLNNLNGSLTSTTRTFCIPKSTWKRKKSGKFLKAICHCCKLNSSHRFRRSVMRKLFLSLNLRDSEFPPFSVFAQPKWKVVIGKGWSKNIFNIQFYAPYWNNMCSRIWPQWCILGHCINPAICRGCM